MQGTVSGVQNAMSGLQQQLAAVQSQNDALRAQLGRSDDRVRGLERCYRDVLGEMVHFQKNLAQQDTLMQGLVQYFLRAEGGECVLLRIPSGVSLFFSGNVGPECGCPGRKHANLQLACV